MSCEAPARTNAAADDGDRAVAISVRGLSKAYWRYEKPTDLIREFTTGRKLRHEQWALRDISFDVPRGSVVGVIGSNGSGKSTLLRVIAGLLDATSGSVDVRGRISAILELGTGFHPDFTGRENIVMGGMCIGMSREEVEARIPWIIDFSELEHVIDEPFRTYSSGMQARLTFSTAVSVEPDTFIVDEALAAGDAFFVNKCMKRIREICSSGATVLFVSHSAGQVAQLCDTAIWLDEGRIRKIGPAREVTTAYDYEIHMRAARDRGQMIATAVAAHGLQPTTPVFRQGPVVIERVTFFDGSGRERTKFLTWEDVEICVEYRCPKDEIPADTLGLAVGIERDIDMTLVAQFSTVNMAGNETEPYAAAPFRQRASTQGVISVKMKPCQLMCGKYLVSLGLLPNIPQAASFYEYHHRAYELEILQQLPTDAGVFYPLIEWTHLGQHNLVTT